MSKVMTAPKSEPSPESLAEKLSQEIHDHYCVQECRWHNKPGMKEFGYQQILDLLDSRERVLKDQIEAAWGVIANAGGGDWGREPKYWQEAANAWGIDTGYRTDNPDWRPEDPPENLTERALREEIERLKADAVPSASHVWMDEINRQRARAERAEEKLAKVVEAARDAQCDCPEMMRRHGEHEHGCWFPALRAALAGPESGGGE